MPEPRESKVEDFDLRGKISRRLSLTFGILFFAVLLVGGFSLYLARSILLSTEEIRRESERIDLVDQMHSTVHHLISALQRAVLSGKSIPHSGGYLYLEELNGLVERYAEGGADREGVAGKIGQMTAEYAYLMERMSKQHQPPAGSGTALLSAYDLEALAATEDKILVLAHLLSTPHIARIEEMVRESRRRMQLILAFYAAFLFIGGFLLLGSSFFFSRTIAQPLRRLAHAAEEVAMGNLPRQVPVTSRDEIGQLSHAFNIMTARLKEHEEKLKALATWEERERLAQELHDSLAQDLALLHLKIVEADHTIATDGVLKGIETLKEMRKIADGAYEDVRQAIFGLRSMVSKSLGLIPTLTEYLHEFSELRKIPVDLRVDDADGIGFSPQVEIQMIRIIHEALANVFRHAEATRSLVRFVRDGDFGKLIIEDDGKGFLPEEAAGKGLHFGLQTMRERAEGVGGRLTIDTAPGKGTRVIVHLPFEKRSYETRSSASGR